MRARLPLVLFGLLALAGVASVAAQGGGSDTRPGLAVFAFDNGGSYGADKEDYDALQRGFAGMLIAELAANPALRLVERDNVQKLLDEQNLAASGRVDAQTAAKVGKLVGARYAIVGDFVELSGQFNVSARVVNVETSEIMKVASERNTRDHLFDIVRALAADLNKQMNFPALPKQVSEQRMSREVPTEALTYYSRALLYQDRGQRDKAIEYYNKALTAFPQYTEASEGLKRLQG
ncbi:MAG TPA: CsgG/HfaB family protein [Gemmatimonadales bacterium]|nr:CsgG/HfaB family protein [Gemmatimonadales bacterium]